MLIRILIILSFIILGGEIASAGTPGTKDSKKISISSSTAVTKTQVVSPNIVPMALSAGAFEYRTTVYTFNDIMLFSYADGSNFVVTNSAGDVIYEDKLNNNTQYSLTGLTSGVYTVVCDHTFTVLVGDALSNGYDGYFAVDQSGKAASTLLNTYMTQDEGEASRFIVFSYNDGTDFSIKNLETGDPLYVGTLNKGEHYTMPTTPYETYLQVSANKPVSALSYGDQDYYVPSTNGTFSGKLFYGYSAYIGSWTNSIVVTAYHDNTSVTVVDDQGTELANTTLSTGQVYAIPVTSETYWTVTASDVVTVATIPYLGFDDGYSYMARAVDESGRGAGTLFYLPTMGSDVKIFSYSDGNKVRVTQLGTYTSYPYTATGSVALPPLVADADGFVPFYNGGVEKFQSPVGQYVFKIESTANVAVLQSFDAAGADFMPLNYSLDLPDLTISSNDITLQPDTGLKQGDQVTVTVRVSNGGPVVAENVLVQVFDGDPDEGVAPNLAEKTFDKIDAAGEDSFSFDYTVPADPEYHRLVVKIDPKATLVEANTANNKAEKFLIANQDLLPPLAVTIDAPDGLSLIEKQPSPNPFTVVANLFNNGTVSATNVTVTMKPLDGLSVASGEGTVVLPEILPNANAKVTWELSADSNVSGYNRYEITAVADNADLKTVRRIVNVPDDVPPASPKGVSVKNGSKAGNFIISWEANNERDLAGYVLYLKDSSGAFSVFQRLSMVASVEVSVSKTNADFELRAFDTSNNESAGSSFQVNKKASKKKSGSVDVWLLLSMSIMLVVTILRRRKNTV